MLRRPHRRRPRPPGSPGAHDRRGAAVAEVRRAAERGRRAGVPPRVAVGVRLPPRRLGRRDGVADRAGRGVERLGHAGRPAEQAAQARGGRRRWRAPGAAPAGRPARRTDSTPGGRPNADSSGSGRCRRTPDRSAPSSNPPRHGPTLPHPPSSPRQVPHAPPVAHRAPDVGRSADAAGSGTGSGRPSRRRPASRADHERRWRVSNGWPPRRRGRGGTGPGPRASGRPGGPETEGQRRGCRAGRVAGARVSPAGGGSRPGCGGGAQRPGLEPWLR